MPIHRPPAGGARPPERAVHAPTSSLLERLLREAPSDYVTLGWLMGHLRERSFGMILLLLGVCALLPVVSPAAGVLLAFPAAQMFFRAHPAPVFPRRLAEYRVTTDGLASVLRRIIPALRYLERFIRPRWPTPFEATKRVVGGVVLLLGALLLTPIPLSNIPIGLTIVLVAFAYLEEDGVLLAVALATSLALLAAAAAALWGMVAAAIWFAT